MRKILLLIPLLGIVAMGATCAGTGEPMSDEEKSFEIIVNDSVTEMDTTIIIIEL